MKRLTIVLLVSGFWFLVSSLASASDWQDYQKSGHRDPKWDHFVESGFTSFDAGNLGPAEMFLQRAIGRGCDDGLVLTKIGLYYEAQLNYKKAAETFKKAAPKLAQQYPNHEMTRSINDFLGRSLFHSGEKNEAIAYLQKAAEKDNFTALYLLGLISKDKKDTKGAIDNFERALKAKHPDGMPKSVDIAIMTELGKSYFAEKNYDESLKWWEEILKVDPANQMARSYRDNIEKARYLEKERKVIEEIVK